jgi:hypothetical protein
MQDFIMSLFFQYKYMAWETGCQELACECDCKLLTAFIGAGLLLAIFRDKKKASTQKGASFFPSK